MLALSSCDMHDQNAELSHENCNENNKTPCNNIMLIKPLTALDVNGVSCHIDLHLKM